MIGRTALSLTALLVLQTLSAQAQPWIGPQGPGAYGPGGGGVMPISHPGHKKHGGHGGHWAPAPVYHGAGPMYQNYTSPADDMSGFGESPVERGLKRLVKNSWFRVEYMNWRIDGPGDTPLGAPLASVDDIRFDFPVFDPATGVQTGVARVPTTREISLDNNNGVRGTIGIPLGDVILEGNIFYLREATHLERETDIPDTITPLMPMPGDPILTRFLATSTFVNGELADNLELYDAGFSNRYSSDVWGTEANLVFDVSPAGEGLHIRPMLGFRYLEIDEGMHQAGVFDGSGTLPPLVSRIGSTTENKIYAPQVGLRTELQHRWFIFTVEPKLGFGVNSFDATVETNQFRAGGDPTVITTQSDTKYTPTFEIGVTLRIPITENLSVFGSYQYLWAGKVTRPHNNIFYNDNGPLPTPPGIVVRAQRDKMDFEGVSIGGEFRFH